MGFRIWDGSDIVVSKMDDATLDFVDVVLDMDDFGTVYGIEILGLFHRYPGMAERLPAQFADASVTKDEEADAMYLRFGRPRSNPPMRSLATLAAILVGLDGELLALRASYAERAGEPA